MDRKTGLIVLGGCGVLVLAVAMFLLGRYSGLAAAASRRPVVPPSATLTQTPRTLQELLPQPGPNQPGEGQGKDCKPIVLFYYQGRLYQIQLGPEGQQGGAPTPSSPPEYFPITPYQGPAIPGLPFPMSPGSPGLPPVGPRF